jgi:hypothetical protein
MGLNSPVQNLGKRSSTPVIGIILLIAVVVVLGSIISVFALSLVEKTSEPAPTAAFDYDYNPETERVTVTMVEGKKIAGDQLRFRGAARGQRPFGSITDWSGKKIGSGASTSVSVNPGGTLRISWQNDDGTDTSEINKYKVPDTTELVPATNANITTFNVDNAAGQYSASPTKNGYTKIELDNIQPADASVYIEISDEAANGYGTDTITDTVVASGTTTGLKSYEMCADITTRKDDITVTVYSRKGGVQLAQDTKTAGKDGSPSGPNDTTGCDTHPG